MGIQINGNTDIISAIDGNFTLQGTTVSVGSSSLTVGSSFIQNNAIGLGTVSTTSRNAGVGTAIGTLIFNSTNNAIEGYGPAGWITVSSLGPITATGGTVIPSATTGNGFTYHIFLGPTTDSLVVPPASSSGNMEMLLVAGGGAGGSTTTNAVNGGGGGAGGIAYAPSYPIKAGITYPITVGAGGSWPGPEPGGRSPNSSDSYSPSKKPGNDTTFTDPSAGRTITSKGGGGGGSGQYSALPDNGNFGGSGGSSGGGAGWANTPVGAANPATQPAEPTYGGLVINYGNTGGPSGNPNSSPPLGVGGGGGGAGTPAPPNADRGGQLNGPPQFNGPGGPGQPFTGFPAPIIAPAIPAPVRPSWTPAVGPTGLFGGGGGAGQFPPISATVGAGGPGGGAAGGPGGTPGPSAVHYTGGGGGGTGNLADATSRTGGAGGHGILIIRYRT